MQSSTVKSDVSHFIASSLTFDPGDGRNSRHRCLSRSRPGRLPYCRPKLGLACLTFFVLAGPGNRSRTTGIESLTNGHRAATNGPPGRRARATTRTVPTMCSGLRFSGERSRVADTRRHSVWRPHPSRHGGSARTRTASKTPGSGAGVTSTPVAAGSGAQCGPRVGFRGELSVRPPVSVALIGFDERRLGQDARLLAVAP